MLVVGPLEFASPLVLLGLISLPILWILLRTMPPPARRQDFPPVVLLGGLKDNESETRSIPPWLRLLRLAAVAAAIVGFADPVLVGEGPAVQETGSPALVLVDAGWAGAGAWERRRSELEGILERRRRGGTPVFVLAATDLPREFPGFREAGEWIGRLSGISPKPWTADGGEVRDWIESRIGGRFDTWWFSDGLELPGHAGLAELLAGRGKLTVLVPPDPVLVLGTPEVSPDSVTVPVRAIGLRNPLTARVEAIGGDGTQAVGSVDLRLEPGRSRADAEFRLPMQLRNRIRSFEAGPLRSAGSVVLVADSLQQRRVALIAGRGPQEGGTLLSSLHFLRRAVEPYAELVEGGTEEMLRRNPDVMIVADESQVPITARDELADWVQGGGHLIRFAGPHLAAGDSLPGDTGGLLPVRLRPGSRALGGTMSWGTPKTLERFPPGSPFVGLDISEGITVSRQVLAQPGPDLADRTFAELEDGTPLVTGAERGSGRIVLFHVPANAEWSNLPLSGLFLEMLERLVMSSGSSLRRTGHGGGDRLWVPEALIDALGTLRRVEDRAGVSGDLLHQGAASEMLPPGIYRSGARIAAVNASGDIATLEAPSWPAEAEIASSTESGSIDLKGWLLAVALLVFLAEGWATFRIGGRIIARASLAAMVAGLLTLPEPGGAQSGDEVAIAALRGTVLAHVITGDAELDRIARAGLVGLSRVIEARTTVELAEPVGIEPGDGTVAMFPLIYWPVSPAGPHLSGEAVENLRNYLRTGGMILFDTRDALVQAGLSIESNGERLIEIAGRWEFPRSAIRGRTIR